MTSFRASEKAIEKAEAAQKDYNLRSNEFRGQLDDQARRLIARTEVENIVKSIEEKISRVDGDLRDLRESRSVLVGKDIGVDKTVVDKRANVAMIVAIIGVLFSGMVGIITVLKVIIH